MPGPATELATLPGLGADALRPRGAHRLDEWPARLQGIAPAPPSEPTVVAPADADGVAAIVRWARATGRRVQALGRGSNVVGAIDAGADVLISLERMSGIEIDHADGVVRAGAG